jgi:threonylcarbamoyladenosine tRNA methylthiotransferase MtaB
VSKERVLEEVKFAQEQGVREVVLTGINLAAWGAGNSRQPKQARLEELLEHLLRHSSIERIRLSSLGPQFIRPGFFDLYADERICDYLHISLQSGSDTVLERMIREHGTDEVRAIAERARAVRPDSAIAADVIAGFPGESEQEHRETLAFIEEIAFAKLHVFPFSPRSGTDAATMAGQLPTELRKSRAAEIRALGQRLRTEFINSQMGKSFQVLGEANGSGLSTNYIRIRTEDGCEGNICTILLSRATLAEQ